MTKSKMSRKIFFVCVLTVFLYPHIYYGCPTVCSCEDIITSCLDRGLTEVPSGIPINTEAFVLSRNQIASLHEGLFSSNVNLRTVRLNSNNITRLPEGLFSTNFALNQVNLQNNQLTSLPEGLFSNNPDLDLVDLRSNQLTSLPAGLFSNSPNVYVRLQDNQLLCCNTSSLIDWIQDEAEILVEGTCIDHPDDDAIDSFNTSVCLQVDGQWSDWSESNCSSICGVGNMTRTRACNKPEPSKYGQRCQGVASDVIECYRDCSTDEEFDWKPLVIGLVVGTCTIIVIIVVVIFCVLKSKDTKVSGGT